MYFFQFVVWGEIKNFCEDIIRKFWHDPIYAIKYRTSHKYNILHTGLEPGCYDLDHRILHGVFNELVNFVECEKAYMNVIWSDNPDFHKRGLFKKFRSPEMGVQYLQWEIDLEGDENKSQSESAKEILALYKWWKEVYLNRPDPLDASGWLAYCHNRHEQGYDIFKDFFNNRTEEQKEESRIALQSFREMEEAYAKEEEEMLIRLIKIRKNLWT